MKKVLSISALSLLLSLSVSQPSSAWFPMKGGNVQWQCLHNDVLLQTVSFEGGCQVIFNNYQAWNHETGYLSPESSVYDERLLAREENGVVIHYKDIDQHDPNCVLRTVEVPSI